MHSRDIENILGRKIRKLRLDNNLTQQELGVKICRSPTTIGKIETNKSNGSYSTLERIAKEFKVPISYLYEPETIEERS
ncbi:helix-turn-helix domain-containing protein [Sporomusa sphaeroides]|uniref:Helix-turn-helix domain protein n=1 Tax=Sporomusa sphaeroides DSM 2875 TaxID=1337886 RepID=A0A1U7M9Y1_9FIRM|nr:helix-turn-helix transcriptional regulator [Sporomusa sphaeroides]OLS54308.1 helix-turn-helix domain protein [Sporomusa sphaeroides DSM 2875]CVK21538.1 Helix-turn-helix domain protein [Sporomusa sphaeroides DSM 2875]